MKMWYVAIEGAYCMRAFVVAAPDSKTAIELIRDSAGFVGISPNDDWVDAIHELVMPNIAKVMESDGYAE